MINSLRVGFWQNGFFADFYFLGPPDFFADFIAGFFLIFVEKVPRKILQENPQQNPLKYIQQKSPTHFCRGAGPNSQLQPEGQNVRGGTRLRGPEVLGPLGGLGIRPLVSASRPDALYY